MNQGWTYRDQVTQPGITVLDYYSQRYRHSSQAEWRARILSGQILLDDAPASPDQILLPGQQLAYHRPPWQEPDVPLEFETLFADADLLVIAKPSGLPVLPGGGFLEHTLLGQLALRYPTETPLPIHRLGRGTSGLMLLARSTQARAALSRQMRHRQIGKVYRALVGVTDLPDAFTVTQPIGKVPIRGWAISMPATAEGQFAQSDCRVVQRQTEATLLDVSILTGRPHQIRIHLASVGYPLLGDPLYGVGGLPLPQTQAKLPVPGDCGYLLHAYKLEFQHPVSAKLMQFSCPPPAPACHIRLMYYQTHFNLFSPDYLSKLQQQILACPYFAVNNLNRDFVGTKGFSVVFRRSHLLAVAQKFPYFQLYLDKALQPDCNAFYLNPLLLKAGSRVDPHIDRSLRSYCKTIEPPVAVSVLYVEVPADLRGGELVLRSRQRQVGKLRPQPNLLVVFQGDLTHSINPVASTGIRLSLVCEQYRLEEAELEEIPEFRLESRAIKPERSRRKVT